MPKLDFNESPQKEKDPRKTFFNKLVTLAAILGMISGVLKNKDEESDKSPGGSNRTEMLSIDASEISGEKNFNLDDYPEDVQEEMLQAHEELLKAIGHPVAGEKIDESLSKLCYISTEEEQGLPGKELVKVHLSKNFSKWIIDNNFILADKIIEQGINSKLIDNLAEEYLSLNQDRNLLTKEFEHLNLEEIKALDKYVLHMNNLVDKYKKQEVASHK